MDLKKFEWEVRSHVGTLVARMDTFEEAKKLADGLQQRTKAFHYIVNEIKQIYSTKS